MKKIIKIFVFVAISFNLSNANEFKEDEPRIPLQKKICSYSKVKKPYGYRTYTIFEDKVSDRVVIFSKKAEKLYTTKQEMIKHDLYDCDKLLQIINEMEVN